MLQWPQQTHDEPTRNDGVVLTFERQKISRPEQFGSQTLDNLDMFFFSNPGLVGEIQMIQSKDIDFCATPSSSTSNGQPLW